MNDLKQFVINNILPFVEMPAQYTGGEWNSIIKGHKDVDVSIAIAFPDAYSIGMSHLGIQIIYFLLNERNDTVCERVFTPWHDMEKEIRRHKIPLFSLETYTPIKGFNIVGFSLQYEMSYTNVLNMLDLAQIPLKREERRDGDPIVIAGGPLAMSPEPMSDFIDIFLLGDGEELLPRFIDRFKYLKENRLKRSDMIASLAKDMDGLYAPKMYKVTYYPEGMIKEIRLNDTYSSTDTDTDTIRDNAMAAPPINAATVNDLDIAYFPDRIIVPFVKTTHDRIAIEIMRGCTRGCRFCNAGMTKRPKRIRSIGVITDIAQRLYKNTGYDEISLVSLSTSDYPNIKGLMDKMHTIFDPKKVNISFPSLRVSEQLAILPSLLNRVRKSGLTIALEASSTRQRRVINKNISNEDLFNGVIEAYRQGWNLVKLYFMIGLPTERDEEIDEILELAYKVSDLKKDITGYAANVHVSIAAFVPKPHTPFQWLPMVTLDRIKEIETRLKDRHKRRSKVKLSIHNPERSILEGIFSRGDRRLGEVILQAWSDGCKFDAWDDYFDFTKWINAFEKIGIHGDFYSHRKRTRDEIFPWDHINCGVEKEFLKREADRAFRGEITLDCTDDICTYCGACKEKLRP